MADIKMINVNNALYSLVDNRIPPLTNNSSTFLRGDGTWANPTEGQADPVDVIDGSTYMTVITDETATGDFAELQAKEGIIPTTYTQKITPDDGYDGLSSVEVKAMPNGKVEMPKLISETGATLSAEEGNQTLTQPVYITPDVVTPGYVENITSGPSSISLTASVPTRKATTITPTKSNQTISSGVYLLGTQTIAGDPDLVPENIKIGTSIFGVNGEYEGPELFYQDKTGIKPTTSSQTIKADSGYDALNSVQVLGDTNQVAGNIKNGTSIFGVKGTYKGDDITYQEKTGIVPSTAKQTITPDAGYSALSSVEIEAMPIGQATAPSSISGSSASLTVGNNSVTLSKTISVTPAVRTKGYVSAGTAGNSAVSLTASMVTRGASTITPSTSNQEIPANVYLTGIQTIKGDSNQLPKNILNGVSIFGVLGTAEPEVTLQSKSVSPSESQQTITPDQGYEGLSKVTVGAVSSTYVGSGITKGSSSSLTVNGATVTVPAGYYSSSASKSVYTATLPTAAESSATPGYTAKATVNRSSSDQYLNIPAGYHSTSSYYKISATPNGTVVPPSQISGTAATVTAGTNTLTLTKTVSVTPNVSTAGYISSGTAGNSSVSQTASVTTKGAATITPSTSNQTIASGTYLTGTQTIAGDADLTAANIKKGVQIFGVTGSYTGDATATASDIISGETAYVNGTKVTGTLVIQTYYTGSSAPASSLGSNGDIYLQT